MSGSSEIVDRGAEETFVHSRKVTEVENVVELDRSSWQAIHQSGIEPDGHLGDFLTEGFVFQIGEGIQMGLQNRVVDTFHIRFVGKEHSEGHKEGEEARVDGIGSASWGQRGSYKLGILDDHLVQEPLALVDVALLDKELEPSNRLLGAIAVHHRHVEVIHKDDQLFAWGFWAEDTAGTLVDVVLEDGLHVLRASSGREVDIESEEALDVKISQKRGNDYRLRCTRVTDKHARVLFLDGLFQ